MAHWTKCAHGCGVHILVNDDVNGPVVCDDCTEEAAIGAGTLVIDEWAPTDRVHLIEHQETPTAVAPEFSVTLSEDDYRLIYMCIQGERYWRRHDGTYDAQLGAVAEKLREQTADARYQAFVARYGCDELDPKYLIQSPMQDI